MSKKKEKKPEKFTEEAMYELGKGNLEKRICHFDLSSIRSKFYDEFFRSLPNIVYKKSIKLKFSCDRQARYQFESDAQHDKILNNSISKNNPRYLQYLLKILREILPLTRTLTVLELSNLDISEIHQKALFEKMKSCRSLKVFKTYNVPITNDAFAKLLKSLSPYQYQYLSFLQTQLSSIVFMNIYKFLKRRPHNDDHWTLTGFDVSDADFTKKEFGKIEDLLSRHNILTNQQLSSSGFSSFDDDDDVITESSHSSKSTPQIQPESAIVEEQNNEEEEIEEEEEEEAFEEEEEEANTNQEECLLSEDNSNETGDTNIGDEEEEEEEEAETGED